MEIKSRVHEHPLKLCEINVNSGKLHCHGCGDPSFGESYSCNNCGFHPRTCYVCDEQPSGVDSFYICEQCWPQSPFFHRSCVDLPEEIQITYRPGCSLKLMKQSSDKSEELYLCDYCNKTNKVFKYKCADCDFQIGVGCASKFIKYHQGKENFQYFGHRHPLVLLELDGSMMRNCKLCSTSINGQCYGCAPCEFLIHLSCRDRFPQEIRRHPFHRQHYSILRLFPDEKPGLKCAACCFDIRGLRYECESCSTWLHPECGMSMKPKVKYSGHPHLLLLIENSSHQSKCEACKSDIKGVFFMRCGECRVDFHVQCGPDPALPPTVLYKEHQQHPLILATNTDAHQVLCCNDCGKEIKQGSFFYRCEEADDLYVAHVSCSVTQVDHGEIMNLRHSSDRHMLTLREVHEDEQILCSGCLKTIQGSTYGCDNCQFFLHKSCAMLPMYIRHQLHPHFLVQTSDNTPAMGACDGCSKNLKGFIYNCSRCKYNLDLDCVSNGRQGIEHFCHKHPLIIVEVDAENCNICCKNITGQCYGCTECGFYIHTPCAELPKVVQHPFHPGHSLTLLVAPYYGYRCNVCRFDIRGFRYRCEVCDFDLHPECRHAKTTIEYSGHDHLLTLIENMTYSATCQACGFWIEGTFFMRCVDCHIDFHVQCGPQQLPTTVSHKQHEHPLTLSTEIHAPNNSDQWSCAVCKSGRNPEHPTYSCADCEYYAHVHCVITKVEIESGRIKHFSHKHWLILSENKSKDGIICSACRNKITSVEAYGCDPCTFYLHESCVKLPRDLQHPFHRHTLSLPSSYYDIGDYYKCNACHKRSNTFSYSCGDCYFKMDLQCSSLHPSIKLESAHEHALTFFNKLYGSPKCERCKSLIPPKELTPLDDSFIRCLKCDFNLHLMCCPLPQTIAHESHLHALALVDKCATLSNHCFEDKYYCDYCETIRSGQECVYYCEKCNFVADLDCVFTEVMQFLEGKHKNLPSKYVRKRSSFSYKDIIETLSVEEKMIMEETLADFLEELKEEVIGELKKKNKDTQFDIFKELKEIDGRISKRLSIFAKGLLDIEPKNHVQAVLMQLDFMREVNAKAELVNIGDYKIIPELAPILEKLLVKYKDIADSYGSRLTPNLKTIALVILCGTLQIMMSTRFCDIDEDSIIMWWFLLKLVHQSAFKIDFALDHLKRITGDYFLIINDTSPESKTFYIIQEKIAQHFFEIENLKKYSEEIISRQSTQKAMNEATQLNNALGKWWKNLGVGLLDGI